MNEVKVIEVTDPKQIVEILKIEISKILSESSEKLMESLPNREDFQTESEYELIKRMSMIELVDQTREIKHNIFSGILENYNNLITEINRFNNKSVRENKESEMMKKYLDSSNKKILVISLGISLLLPGLIPLVLIIDVPRLGTNMLLKKYFNERLVRNKITKNIMTKTQDPYYELTDTLRTDYHKSKEELNELEHKAIIGEDISGKIKEILNPERIGIKAIDLYYPEEVIVKEKSKQL